MNNHHRFRTCVDIRYADLPANTGPARQDRKIGALKNKLTVPEGVEKYEQHP